MNEKDIKDILKRGKPWPEGTTLWGVANLGAWYTEREVEAVVSSIRDSMDWLTGFGPNPKEIEEFENAFAAYIGCQYAVALNSCGTGLDISVMSLNLEPGDEIICPAVNYKAAHLSIIGFGGKVVFCDIDPTTLNADPEDIERRITPKTRAIMPVHMNGLPADIDSIMDVAERHPHPKHGPLKVIFDAARCCGASYKDSKIGDKGWMSVFSFQTQKFITTLGEGGMLTTNDPQIIEKVRELRHFGGEDGWGSNYKMTKVQAAVGLVQLERLDEMNARRKEVARYRTELLKDSSDLILPAEPPGYEHLYYLYSMLTPKGDQLRDKLMEALAQKYGIMCSVTNPPTYQRWSYIRQMCGDPKLPVSDDVGARLICLPIHPLMSTEMNEYVCAALLNEYHALRRL
ncbi:DegT/DnrJ/EryC1/StrS family aminotransferase [Candidatus Magnetomonas plexicatena]|uniref:DegT/DnrJ/EryC1/StrS family aminotransferase n=1 Tax=Candidatus Magnetomonas plexicatena TaxID=2552947 RepID=UPI0011007D24|nr:DegT/DnrJ/EryC1/StrS family aminotransferase [Nitrospirales bacterium LBB_01]